MNSYANTRLLSALYQRGPSHGNRLMLMPFLLMLVVIPGCINGMQNSFEFLNVCRLLEAQQDFFLKIVQEIVVLTSSIF